MARNRVIYQSEAVYSAPTGTTSLSNATNSLRRVQSVNYNFSVNRTDINQYGELAAIDRLITQEPTVGVDINYYFEATGFNERALGFRTDAATGTSTVTDHMLDYIISSGANYDQKNIYILTSTAGIDANDTGAMASSSNYDGIIGIGNAFVNSWSLDAAVGAIPTVSVSFDAQNIVFTGGITSPVAPNPALIDGVDPLSTVTLPSGAGLFNSATEISAIRPGDITLTLGTTATDNAPVLGFSEVDLKVQSVNVKLNMSREPLRKLGKMFAFSREISFPVTCTMSVNAIVSNAANAKLYTLFTTNGDNSTYNCTLKLDGYLSGSSTPNSAYVILKGAKINSENITSAIGSNKSVAIELSAQIGRNAGLHFRSA